MTTRQDLAWWQKLLMAMKLWRPTYRTLHHEVRDLERPAVPPVTGAYGHSMGSNYNMVRRPAVVFVRNGEARLVVRRETHEDLLIRDMVVGPV